MASSRQPKQTLYRPRIFNVYKPVGLTSGTVLNHYKHHLPRGFGKIGHFGTLDPFAEGVFLIGIAGAQKLNECIHEELPKTYWARGLVGIQTSTGDCQGEVLHKDTQEQISMTLGELSCEQLTSLWQKSFLGSYSQRPPAFSATKHEGKALYEYARAGIMIEKPPVEREIYQLDVLERSNDEICFRATVSSGTYIRTLFEDMMKEMGLAGHLLELKREAIGGLTVDTALGQEGWPERGSNQNYILEYGVSVDTVLNWPHVVFDHERSRVLTNGGTLRKEQGRFVSSDGSRYWAHSQEGELLGAVTLNDDSWRLLVNFSGTKDLA